MNCEYSVALWDIRSLHNVGAIFRTADGAGFKQVILGGITGTPPDRRLAKVSLGAEDHLSWTQQLTIESFLDALKGNVVVALEQSPDSLSFPEIAEQLEDRWESDGHSRSNPWRVTVLLGNELTGLPPELLERVDYIAEIPMRGHKESLNVSVAFGVAAYALSGLGNQSEFASRNPGSRVVRDGVLTRGVTSGQNPH